MNVAALYHQQTLRAFAAEVIHLAESLRWRVLHDGTSRLPHPCRACAAPQPAEALPLNLPHLILVRRPRILFVALRAERGVIHPDRAACLAELAQHGQEIATWAPHNVRQIEQVLR